MRLELTQIDGSGGRPVGMPKWSFERGRRTLGRAADCDWQVPGDQRGVSTVHCIIERDAGGFLLRDRSANGSRVNGRLVHEGETARLEDRSRLELGGLAFAVHISGEGDRPVDDPDSRLALSDETLTISAILADVAPGGATATGILGERGGQDWVTDVPVPKQGAASSRNVEIGWSGPPDVNALQPILPNDWNAESDLGSHLEHGSATRVSVPMARSRPADTADAIGKPLPPNDDASDISQITQVGQKSEQANRLNVALRRLEEALENGFAALDIELPADGADVFGLGAEQAAIARVDALVARQLRLNAALQAMLGEASRLMEPRILEAKVDAGSGLMPWRRSRSYWRAYRAQFEKDGRTLSARDVLRAAMLQATGAEFGAEDGYTAPAEQQGETAHHEK